MTDPDITETLSPAARKARLRGIVLAARDREAARPGAIESAAAAVAGRALGDTVLTTILRSCVVAGYWPIRSEIDPRPLMQVLAARGCDLSLPVVTPQGLVFRRWRAGDMLTGAGLGTLGPPPGSPALSPDVLLVPLAAVDRTGNRLGYGRGYYDAVIAGLSAGEPGKPFTVGLGYDLQLVDAVPAESHDRPLDAIVTPMQSIIVNNSCRMLGDHTPQEG